MARALLYLSGNLFRRRIAMTSRTARPKTHALLAASVLVAGFAIATHTARAQGCGEQADVLTHGDTLARVQPADCATLLHCRAGLRMARGRRGQGLYDRAHLSRRAHRGALHGRQLVRLGSSRAARPLSMERDRGRAQPRDRGLALVRGGSRRRLSRFSRPAWGRAATLASRRRCSEDARRGPPCLREGFFFAASASGLLIPRDVTHVTQMVLTD